VSDIASFAASLLPSAHELLRQWLPAGKLRGVEYVVGNLRGEPGESLSINTRTGLWADFSDDSCRGGDLLSLYAAIHGMKQGEAAKALGWTNGSGGMPVALPIQPANSDVQAVPDGVDPPPVPAGVTAYQYHDTAGKLLYVIHRTEATETERKSFRPYTYRGGKWQAKAWPAPRPLFGLETLADGKRVLLVEGEKACLAARQIFGPYYCCLTWAGGAAAVNSADWSPLYGRDIDLWPDADEPGSKAMAAVLDKLVPKAGGATIRLLKQDGQPEGWDLADALADGWDMARVTAHVKREGGIQVIGGTALQVGKPHDGNPPVATVPASDGKGSVYVLREQLKLLCNASGPFSTEANAIAALRNHPDYTGKIWLDEFAQELMYGDVPLDRTIAIELLVWFQSVLQMHKLPLSAVERAAVIVCHHNRRHPVKQWLDTLAWDGVPRLAGLMPDGFGCERNAYSEAVGRCWIVAMVARIYEPGCQADNMPVFEGSQGIFKSSAMRILGGQWFMESHVDPIRERKEFLQSLQGHWLIEIPEMHTIAGHGETGINKIKGLISNRSDTYREPYGTKTRPYPRQCIFAGTTNADQWNPDSTGGRRFWPIRCGAISREWLTENREQLFAEALAEYRAGTAWYDVPAEAAREEQEARRERDVWEELIVSYCERQMVDTFTVGDILSNCLRMDEKEFTQAAQNRVARSLKANGYMRCKVTIPGGQKWVYRKSRAISTAQAPDNNNLDDF